MSTFDLTQKVKIVTPNASSDSQYGPYNSIGEALTATENLRELGRTVGIIENGVITEYWFKEGITDLDLVIKESNPSELILPNYPNNELPVDAPDGELAFDTTNQVIVVSINGEWVPVGSGGGGNSSDYISNESDVDGNNVTEALNNLLDQINNIDGFEGLTGDVTAGPDGVTTISNGVVTNEKLDSMPANSIKGRATGIGAPSDILLGGNTLLGRRGASPLASFSVGSNTLVGRFGNGELSDNLITPNTLVGRGSGSLGVITLGSNLSFDGNVLNVTGISGGDFLASPDVPSAYITSDVIDNPSYYGTPGSNSIYIGRAGDDTPLKGAIGDDSIAIGFDSSAGTRAVAIGRNATASATSNLAIGNGAFATAINSMQIGNGIASGIGTINIGNSVTSAGGAIKLGNGGTASTGDNSLALGHNTSTQYQYSIALGFNALTTKAHQMVIGSNTPQYAITEIIVPQLTIDDINDSSSGRVLVTKEWVEDVAITEAEADLKYVQPNDLSTVAFSGSYNDLSDKPSISGLELGETSTTAYRGDRGKEAYDHISLTNNPHNVTKSQVGLGNVDNTSDLNKPISTATQTALSGLQDQINNIDEFEGLTGDVTAGPDGVTTISDGVVTNGMLANQTPYSIYRTTASGATSMVTLDEYSIINRNTGGISPTVVSTNSVVGRMSGNITSIPMVEMYVYDNTATPYTLANLQTMYPTSGGYAQGFEVRCFNLNPPITYRKDSVDDNYWVSTSHLIVT